MKTLTPQPLDIRLMRLATRALWLVLLVMGISSLSYVIGNHAVFALRGISVWGDTRHNDEHTLRAQLAPYFSDADQLSSSFVMIDLAATRAAFEQVPWVRRAEVRREFPNRLKVILQEHRAVAYWGGQSESTLVNNYGEVFEADLGEVDEDELPRLNGPKEQSGQVLSLYRALQSKFDRHELQIAQLELTGRGNWRAQLKDGAQIELGRGSEEELMARASQFVETLGDVALRYGRTPGALESADLRYGQGYAVRLKGVSTVLTAVQAQKK